MFHKLLYELQNFEWGFSSFQSTQIIDIKILMAYVNSKIHGTNQKRQKDVELLGFYPTAAHDEDTRLPVPHRPGNSHFYFGLPSSHLLN